MAPKNVILAALAALIFPAVCLQAQTRSLIYNATNGEVIANTGTNVLTFTNDVQFGGGDLLVSGQVISGTGVSFSFEDADFAYGATLVRINLGFSTNLDTLWTATNASNARSAVGLGAADTLEMQELRATQEIIAISGTNWVRINTSSLNFSGPSQAAITRTNLGLGATWLTNTNVTNFRTAIGLGTTNNVEFNELRLGGSGQMHIRGAAGNISFYNGIEAENVLLIPADTDPVEINSQWNNAGVRSNIGLPLAALTNTSNVTIMRALSGSTNTNHPYSGSISVVGTNNTNTLVFSNGTLVEVQ